MMFAFSDFHYARKKGDMFECQSLLPSLPVPPLRQTLERYLHSVRPLTSKEEFQNTKETVEEFGKNGGRGEELQKKLLDRAEKTENWLKDWWEGVAYMEFRPSLVIHSSPAMVSPRLNIPNMDTFVGYAACLIVSYAMVKVYIDGEQLSVNRKGRPAVCVEQFRCIFSRHRTPGEKVDVHRVTAPSDSLHVIIAHNGHERQTMYLREECHCIYTDLFFKLQVLYPCPDGTLQIAPWDHLKQQISDIIAASPSPARHQVGLLTTEHRDNWYKARQNLIKDPTNLASLDAMETALFMLCLDKAEPRLSPTHGNVPFLDPSSTAVAQRLLHGCGPDVNSANRWFDMTVMTMLAPDGGCGALCEHSAVDGTCTVPVTEFALKNCLELGSGNFVYPCAQLEAKELKTFRELKWTIVPETEAAIQEARRNLITLINNLDVNHFQFDAFGKGQIKKMRVSPDAFIQQAIQLAFYRKHGRTPATYESASTRQFKLARTETIRTQSPESLTFCKAMCEPSANLERKMASFKAAVDYHTWFSKEAVNAQGVDRHLMGLKRMSAESGMETPSIFTDPAYAQSITHDLSTSQVPASLKVYFCFGPTSEGGYGIGYNPQEDCILFSITSYNSAPETDCLSLGCTITETFAEMMELLQQSACQQ